MATADTAKLLASLELQDKFTPTAKRALGSIDQMDKGFSKLGATASRGLNTAITNIARIGVVAAGGLGLMVKEGIGNLEKLESAEAAVTGALSQMGMAGKVTAGQVATWANQIEANVGAAFDDKAIVAASATLIRYGKVTADNLQPAMAVMTDLAAKTGDVDSAATLLAKALAAPEAAAGKLARTGVILTKAQQDQIKAMVKAGDAAGAQAYLLRELEKTTKGAAAASQGPYKRAMSLLADATEDAQKALAEGFLPVIEKVATWLSTKLADPKVITDIRNLGVSLAGAFDKALTFAGQIPWDSIKDAMTLAGQGAKAALDLFTGLPPWVQTAVLTGWGLNKLTGGALGDIVGQLGSGLIKGVLGMNAGVVNINAGVVNGGAGGIGDAAKAAGGIGLAGLGAIAASVIGSAAVAAAAISLVNTISGITPEEIQKRNNLGQFGPRSASNLPPKAVTPGSSITTVTNTGGAAMQNERAVALLAQNLSPAKLTAVSDKAAAKIDEMKVAATNAWRASERAALAVSQFKVPAPAVTVNVANTISIRDMQLKTGTYSTYGVSRAIGKGGNQGFDDRSKL